MKRLGILISGRGSNFLAIADSIAEGRLATEIAVVISNRRDAPGLELARARGFKALWISAVGLTREQHDLRIAKELEGCDLICCAGYMRLFGSEFIQKFRGKLLNIHPSLLPSFPGLEPQRQALEHGVKIAGCTVHFVDDGLDSGPILMQAAVPVLEGDTVETLSARILKEEHRLYTEAIASLL